MTILCKVSKKTNRGISTWNFCLMDGNYFCINQDQKVIRCQSVDELRSMYTRFTKNPKYGYTLVQDQPEERGVIQLELL